jgi:hypothetical protein
LAHHTLAALVAGVALDGPKGFQPDEFFHMPVVWRKNQGMSLSRCQLGVRQIVQKRVSMGRAKAD